MSLQVKKKHLDLDVLNHIQSVANAAVAVETAARVSGDAATLASAQSYADGKVAALVNSAPATLDTLKELADALGNDPNLSVTLTAAIGSVQSALNAEISNRTVADQTLQTAINSEQSARITADAGLQSQISAEVSARSSADLEFLKTDGTRSMTEDLKMGQKKVINVAGLVNSSGSISIESNGFSVVSMGGPVNIVNQGFTVSSYQDIVLAATNSTLLTLKKQADSVLTFTAIPNGMSGSIKLEAVGNFNNLELGATGAGQVIIRSNSLFMNGNQVKGVGDGSDQYDAVNARQLLAEQTARVAGDTNTLNSAHSYTDSVFNAVAQSVGSLENALDAEVLARQSADTVLQNGIDSLKPYAYVFAHEYFTIDQSHIDNGYVELANYALPASIQAFVDRLAIHYHTDYSASPFMGKMRINFTGPLAVGGAEALSVGDILTVKYAYIAGV